MTDVINFVVDNPLSVAFLAFIVFCLVKGGKGKGSGGGNNTDGTKRNQQTTPQQQPPTNTGV